MSVKTEIINFANVFAKMTYYTNILKVLPEYPISFEEIMNRLMVHDNKKTYVIDALKNGIELETIIQYKNPNEKRLFVGHTYSLQSNPSI